MPHCVGNDIYYTRFRGKVKGFFEIYRTLQARYIAFTKSAGPFISAIDGAFVIGADGIALVGFAARHMQAKLAVIAIAGNGLVAVGLGADGAGHEFAVGVENHSVAVPIEATAGNLHELGGVGAGDGLTFGVSAAAGALDMYGDAGVDVVDIAMLALFQHAAAAVVPVELDDLALPCAAGEGGGIGGAGLDLFGGQAAGEDIARSGAGFILHAAKIAADAHHIDLAVDLDLLFAGRGGCLRVDIGALTDVGHRAGFAVQVFHRHIARHALQADFGPAVRGVGHGKRNALGESYAGAGCGGLAVEFCRLAGLDIHAIGQAAKNKHHYTYQAGGFSPNI